MINNTSKPDTVLLAELSTALMIYVTLLKYFIFCINDNLGGILGWGGGV